MKKKLHLMLLTLMVVGIAFTSCKKDDSAKDDEQEQKKEDPKTEDDKPIVPLHTFKLGETLYQVTGSGVSLLGGYRLVMYQSGSMVMTIMMNAKPTTGKYTLEPLNGMPQASAGKAQISVLTYKSSSEGTMHLTVSGNKATVVMNNINLPSQLPTGSATKLSAYFEVTLDD